MHSKQCCSRQEGFLAETDWLKPPHPMSVSERNACEAFLLSSEAVVVGSAQADDLLMVIP